MSRASEEYQMAIRILREAGFSNTAIDEMVMQRMDHRDKFAIAALTGIMVHANWDTLPVLVAQRAYAIADACLEVRRED